MERKKILTSFSEPLVIVGMDVGIYQSKLILEPQTIPEILKYKELRTTYETEAFNCPKHFYLWKLPLISLRYRIINVIYSFIIDVLTVDSRSAFLKHMNTGLTLSDLGDPFDFGIRRCDSLYISSKSLHIEGVSEPIYTYEEQ